MSCHLKEIFEEVIFSSKIIKTPKSSRGGSYKRKEKKRKEKKEKEKEKLQESLQIKGKSIY
jgi:hypothetical protein